MMGAKDIFGLPEEDPPPDELPEPTGSGYTWAHLTVIERETIQRFQLTGLLKDLPARPHESLPPTEAYRTIAARLRAQRRAEREAGF
jgi:hypothetical protein